MYIPVEKLPVYINKMRRDMCPASARLCTCPVSWPRARALVQFSAAQMSLGSRRVCVCAAPTTDGQVRMVGGGISLLGLGGIQLFYVFYIYIVYIYIYICVLYTYILYMYTTNQELVRIKFQMHASFIYVIFLGRKEKSLGGKSYF